MLDQHTNDSWNPVFWKEMHLMYQNRSLIAVPVIAGCLVVLFLAGLSYLRIPLENRELWFGNFSETGLCGFYYVILALVSLGWVVTQVFTTTSSEHGVEGLDPLLGTRLTPARVLAGKYAAMLVCMGISQVIALPFFFLAGRLEPKHWLAFATLFCCLVAAGAWLILLGCLPRKGTGKGVSLSQLFCAIGLLPLAGCYLHTMIRLAERPHVTTNDPSIRIQLTIILAMLAVIAYAWTLSLAMLRNTRQERSCPWRLCTLAVWLLMPSAVWLLHQEGRNDGTWFGLQATFGFLLCCVCAGFCMFERMFPSRRTLVENATRGGVAKLLQLPFRSGVGPGLVLAWLLYLVSCGMYCCNANFTADEADGVRVLQAVAGYMLLYASLIAVISDYFKVQRELVCGIFIAIICFLPIFASMLGLGLLAAPSVFAALRQDEGTAMATFVVPLLAVIPCMACIFQYCYKYFCGKK